MSTLSTKEEIQAALEALEKLDLRSLKNIRYGLDQVIDTRTTASVGGGDYSRALRDCLIDCQAFLDSARHGRLRHEHMGQLDVLLADMRNLINREDVPTYRYKKGT